MQVQVQEMAPQCLASACFPGPHYPHRYFLPKSTSEKGANASKAKRWKCRNCLSEVIFVPAVTTVKENIGFIKEERDQTLSQFSIQFTQFLQQDVEN